MLRAVHPDRVWGGWRFEGDLKRPGEACALPEGSVVLECAGETGSGWGHRRRPTLYLLWRLEGDAWRELARCASVDRDWTVDLGPIARRALRPPTPVLVDPAAAAGRVLEALERELEPLARQAQRLVLLAVWERMAGRMVV